MMALTAGTYMSITPNYGRTGEELDLVASHQRVLIGAALKVPGRMLELGVGWYSTPLLHEIAEMFHRPLLTADNIDYWLAQFLPLESEFHHFDLVGWWGEAYQRFKLHHWSLCFVDHGQPIEREYAIRALFDRVDVFVMHDTEELHAYGYKRTLPMFKYQWTDKTHKLYTTVASNSIDVSNWFKELPSVEPTTEVT